MNCGLVSEFFQTDAATFHLMHVLCVPKQHNRHFLFQILNDSFLVQIHLSISPMSEWTITTVLIRYVNDYLVGR